MNNNLMLFGLLAAAFLFLRRPTQSAALNLPWVPGQMENPVPVRESKYSGTWVQTYDPATGDPW